MDKREIIALTGVIGGGKSAVAEQLATEFGIPVIDADQVARDVVTPGSPTLVKIIAHFGEGFLNPDGSLNRKLLGAHIFRDTTARKELEAIVHPAIREHSKTLLRETAATTTAPFVVYMVPLFFEAGGYPEITRSVAVIAPRETCIERIMARDGSTRELAEQKFDAQLPPEEKRQRATLVIENDGSREQLKEAVRELMRKEAFTGAAS